MKHCIECGKLLLDNTSSICPECFKELTTFLQREAPTMMENEEFKEEI